MNTTTTSDISRGVVHRASRSAQNTQGTTFQYQVASDLHIERFLPNVPDWRAMITPVADTLILAGDIGHVEHFNQYKGFLAELAKAFKLVILVPGNHEYYSQQKTFTELKARLHNLQIANLHVLDDSYYDLPGGIRIYGTTLWAAIPEDRRVMNLPIRPHDRAHFVGATWLNRMHHQAVYELEEAILAAQQAKKRLMVVSHYAPTQKGTVTAAHLQTLKYHYYANNLDRLLHKENVYVWIFGHTHVNCDYLTAGDTRVFSNQLPAPGYQPRKVYTMKKPGHSGSGDTRENRDQDQADRKEKEKAHEYG